jgi:YbgC/YbaW family acyl-CoA thioester hydrolase
MIYGKTHIYFCDASFDLIDAGKALYHPNYLILCDRARSDALQKSGYSFYDIWNDGFALALRKNTSEYFRPIGMGQQLAILTRTTEVSGTSLYLEQTMVSKEHLNYSVSLDSFIEGTLTIPASDIIHQVTLHLVCIRHSDIKPARLPEKLIHSLKLPLKIRSSG